MTTREAEELLDNAVCGDLGTFGFEMPTIEEIRKIGVKNLHLVYYDGGWVTHPIITRVLSENPHGFLAKLLRIIIDERVSDKEYTEETLMRMYNLLE